MRMLMHVSFPVEEFNDLVKNGTAGKKIKKIMKEVNPEAAYFTERDGERGVYLIVNVEEPSRVPALAEPWFLTFNARVEFKIVMTPEELEKADLDGIGKKW